MENAPPGCARIVLVTGVAHRLGSRLAMALQADPHIERVIGVDTDTPPEPLGRTEFVRVDIRTPAIARLVESVGVDTVVHVGLVTAPGAAGGRGAMKEINVIGTMQLLAACQRAVSLRRLVARSTTVVYGSSAHAPAMFTEEMEPATLPRQGYAKDAWEVEGYVRGFSRRRPDVSVSTLRFAPFMGPGVVSSLTRYFALPVVPTVLGFDPRLQFVHEDDGLEVLRRMTVEDHPGTFNVTGPGIIMLSQAIRRAGRPAMPIPAPTVETCGQICRRLGIAEFSPEDIRMLSHGRAADSSRLAGEMGWRPAYSTVGAFDDFVRGRGLTRLVPVDTFGDLAQSVLGWGATGRPEPRAESRAESSDRFWEAVTDRPDRVGDGSRVGRSRVAANGGVSHRRGKGGNRDHGIS